MAVTPDNDAAIGLLLSGGLDSSILLAHLLESGRHVQPFYVQSGLHWQRDEFWALRAFLITIDSPPARAVGGLRHAAGRSLRVSLERHRQGRAGRR